MRERLNANHAGKPWIGIAGAMAICERSSTWVLSMALGGKVRSTVPPSGGPRLYSVEDLERLASQTRELMAS